jgi:hypothetical protein
MDFAEFNINKESYRNQRNGLECYESEKRWKHTVWQETEKRWKHMARDWKEMGKCSKGIVKRWAEMTSKWQVDGKNIDKIIKKGIRKGSDTYSRPSWGRLSKRRLTYCPLERTAIHGYSRMTGRVS